jgi:hypothetical protein
MKLSKEDLEWLAAKYPTLSVIQGIGNTTSISGWLSFDMLYEAGQEKYHINPNPEIIKSAEGVRIHDKFEIRIEFGEAYLPKVFEIGERLEKIAQDKKIPLSDMHINGDGSACLCVKTEERLRLPENADLSDFFYDLLIPFFYQQSYFEKNNKWPWGQYGHGVFGLLEWYADNSIDNKDEFMRFLELISDHQYWQYWDRVKGMLNRKKGAKGHLPCICGSNRKVRECHQYAWQGIRKLEENYRYFGLHRKR